MINKIITPQDWDFDVPVASLVDVLRDGHIDSTWAEKRASSDQVMAEFDGVRPGPNKSLIHLIAMGASEVYGANRNGDTFYSGPREFDFPEKDWKELKLANGTTVKKSAETFKDKTDVGLRECHKTFVELGHVFRDHLNRPQLGHKIHGEVKKSAFNEKMARVELLIEVPNDTWEADLHKLASGEPVGFSMSCSIDYDICSVTGLKQRTRAEYGPYAANHLGKLLKSGHQVNVINDHMKFFDISRVQRNADRIALGLRKVASEILSDPPELGVFKQADLDGVLDIRNMIIRKVLLEKAAEMEKRIRMEGRVKAVNCGLCGDMDDAEEGFVTRLSSSRTPDIFAGLYHNSIIVPFDLFAKLVLGEHEGKKQAAAAKTWLPVSFQLAAQDSDNVACDSTFIPLCPGNIDGSVKVALDVLNKYNASTGGDISTIKNIINRAGVEIRLPQTTKSASDAPHTSKKLLNAYTTYRLAVVSGLPENCRNDVLRQIVTAEQLY